MPIFQPWNVTPETVLMWDPELQSAIYDFFLLRKRNGKLSQLLDGIMHQNGALKTLYNLYICTICGESVPWTNNQNVFCTKNGTFNTTDNRNSERTMRRYHAPEWCIKHCGEPVQWKNNQTFTLISHQIHYMRRKRCRKSFFVFAAGKPLWQN